MQMKKKGFTLAEVLITMALLGVIAALTIPTSMYNIHNSKISAGLKKAYNVLVNANLRIIYDKEALNLKWTFHNSGTEYMEAFLSYIYARQASNNVTYYDIDKSTVILSPKSNESDIDEDDDKDSEEDTKKDSEIIVYTTIDGMSYIYDPNKHFNTRDEFIVMYVDINGSSNRPNALGIDTFVFVIMKNGDAIPYGGEAWAKVLGGDSPMWEGNCYNDTPVSGETCGASVLDNNGSVKYKW